MSINCYRWRTLSNYNIQLGKNMLYLNICRLNLFNEVKELLNENKIKMMTKMAIYEKNEGKSMLKTAKYFKGDYIAFGVLKTVIATTFAGVILLAMYFLCNAEGLYRTCQEICIVLCTYAYCILCNCRVRILFQV